jgi:hypothetical protein
MPGIAFRPLTAAEGTQGKGPGRMEKAAGTYVTDVRWWLTFQKAVPGKKYNIQQTCAKKWAEQRSNSTSRGGTP